MRRRALLWAALVLAATPAGRVLCADRMRRVAVISLGALDQQPLQSLVDTLKVRGWENGRNLDLIGPGPGVEYGQMDRLARAAVERKAEVLVAFGTTAVTAALKATRSTPVVMVLGTDPVELGFVTSLSRPEGNATGLATNTQVLIEKRVELLKELLPRLRRLAAIWNSESAGQAASLDLLRATARRDGIEVSSIDIRGNIDANAVARLAAQARAEALLPLPSTQIRLHGPLYVAVADKLRLPAVYSDAEQVAGGGLMSYSSDGRDQMRRAAGYVDRLLNGAKPAELPIEQPARFELVVNLGSAKKLGLKVPRSILVRADRVIE